MKVKDVIALLQQHNQEAELIVYNSERMRATAFTDGYFTIVDTPDRPYFASGKPNTEGPYVLLSMVMG